MDCCVPDPSHPARISRSILDSVQHLQLPHQAVQVQSAATYAILYNCSDSCNIENFYGNLAVEAHFGLCTNSARHVANSS